MVPRFLHLRPLEAGTLEEERAAYVKDFREEANIIYSGHASEIRVSAVTIRIP